MPSMALIEFAMLVKLRRRVRSGSQLAMDDALRT